MQRASALLDIQRFPDAIVLYERALSIEPEDPAILTCLAYSVRMVGDRKASQQYAERALQTDPEYDWAYRELTYLRLEVNDLSGAYKKASMAVQVNPENIYSLHLLGHCAVALDRTEEARLLADSILDLAPDEIEGHDLHAKVAEEEGDIVTAVERLQKALEIDPEDAVIIERLAKAQRQLKQDAASASYYQAALHADPHDRGVQASLKDSLHQLALFGERGQRRRSPAARLGVLTGVYLATWYLLVSQLAATNNHCLDQPNRFCRLADRCRSAGLDGPQAIHRQPFSAAGTWLPGAAQPGAPGMAHWYPRHSRLSGGHRVVAVSRRRTGRCGAGPGLAAHRRDLDCTTGVRTGCAAGNRDRHGARRPVQISPILPTGFRSGTRCSMSSSALCCLLSLRPGCRRTHLWSLSYSWSGRFSPTTVARHGLPRR